MKRYMRMLALVVSELELASVLIRSPGTVLIVVEAACTITPWGKKQRPFKYVHTLVIYLTAM